LIFSSNNLAFFVHLAFAIFVACAVRCFAMRGKVEKDVPTAF
jgi:hypothetical protein